MRRGDVASTAVAFAVGLVDPVLGTVVAPGLRYVAGEVAARYLGESDQQRLGIVLERAVIEIESRLTGGEALRRDGFFDTARVGDRSVSVEVGEAVLIAATRSAQG